MKKIFILSCLISITYASSTYDEIINLSNSICDKLETKGTITVTKVKASLEGNTRKLSKILGITLNADGSIEYNNKSYDGLPYEELSKQMSDSRQCKKELAMLILNKQNDLNKINKYYLHNPITSSVGILKDTSLKIQRLCTVESGTSVKRISEKKEPYGNFVKVEILDGDCKGTIGWIEQSNLKRIIN